MSSVVISGDTSGAITLSAPAVAGTNTLTLPANTGTVLTTASTFGGTGPAFSAYNSSSQSIATATATKVTLDAESFDTNSNFASNRFTPTVAGYYQINGSIFFNTGVVSLNYIIYIYKNGVAYRQIPWSYNSTANYFCGTISDVISMNGTTDYLELYVIQYSGISLTLQGSGSSAGTYLSGSMVRSA